MIQPYFIRSTIFNLCFYIITAIFCIILLPTLILPRKYYMAVVYGFVYVNAFLEKHILGLRYEIKGKEYLPSSGSYIIAAKHQSAYETFKLHILFNDPAIVLKKELLKIPLWGLYLAKSDVIAIDRSTPKVAIKSLQDGAKRVMKQGRPIIIFPQGTRVAPDISAKEKPYKIGIIRIQEATNLPIIPMALNTGIFYPKHKWCKKPGTVIFEFLPPILPSKDKNASDILREIETEIEGKTAKIMEEARSGLKNKIKSSMRIFINLLLVALLSYSIFWFYISTQIGKSISNLMTDIKTNPNILEYKGGEPKIYGFPFKIQLSLPKQIIKTPREKITIESIKAKSWPFPNMPVTFSTGKIRIDIKHWNKNLEFDGIDGEAQFWNNILQIKRLILTHKETKGVLSGDIKLHNDYPIFKLKVELTNHQNFINDLVNKKIIKARAATFASVALRAMQKDGVISTTITSQDNKVYLGAINIYEFPNKNDAYILENGKPSSFATRRVKPVPAQ